MATLVQVRALYRRPLRLGSTRISAEGNGTAVDLDDGAVRRDMYRHLGSWVVVDDNFVTAVATSVADSDPLTSAGGVDDAAGDPPTDVEFNALVADHNALRDDVAALQAKLQEYADCLVDHNFVDNS